MEARSERRRGWHWTTTGLCVGLALSIGRLALVFAMDHWGRGFDAAMTRWRVAERTPWVVPIAIVSMLACAWIVRPAQARATSATRLVRGVRFLVVAAIVIALLTGWPIDDAFHIPGFGSRRGEMTLAAIAVFAFALAAVLPRVVSPRGIRYGDPTRVPGGGARFVALTIACALVLGAYFAQRNPGSSMVVREVARDLSIDVGDWTVVTARPAAPPYTASVTPSLHARLDASELPALVMPPPCSVTRVIGADEVGLRFHAAAGCDLSVAAAFERRDDAPTIVFRVRVDDRVVLEGRRTPWAGEADEDTTWTRLAGGSGIDVEPGSRLTLETAFEGGTPSEEVADRAAQVGFGGLLLERRVERPRTRATPERPNIVLVVMDTLRADRTSLHGYARPTTPVLDALAARGTMFEQAFTTSSWTLPSTASILTGLDPAAHGVISDGECYLADELETLPEVLQREGYTTGAFACNPLIGPTRNFDAGFESFESTAYSFLMSEQVMPSVLGWIDAHASVRFFLYLHLVDPHELHRSRESDRRQFAGPMPDDLDEHALHEYSGRLQAGEGRASDGSWEPERVVSKEHLRWLSDAYDAAVATGDHALGRILARLDELSLRDDTLIVFTSDHGEELLEHGHLQHGQALYTELVHVPLVLAGPGIAAGVRRGEPVSNRHLGPTLARVGGARLAIEGGTDLREKTAPEALFLATESGWWNGERQVPVRALRDAGWSLHMLLGSEAPARLYDLSRDPGELVDVSAAQAERASAWRVGILELGRAQSALRPRAVRAGAGTREMLRATGYAGDER